MKATTTTWSRHGSRASRTRAAAVAVAAMLALVTAACSPAPPDSAATTAPAAAVAAIAWTPCDPGLECAKVPVPMDWMNPSGEKIQLAVIRHKASKPDQRIGSIFFNPGGPGDTGVGAVKGAADDLDAWGNGRFDIVSWDPRGTYGSSPIRCFTDDASEAAFWKDAKVPYTPEASVAYQQRVLDLAKRCGEVMGPLLSHVSTADTARDIDALRAGLGEDKITYAGLSYGTVLGQTYLNMFPQHVRAMMLDSVVDGVPYTKSAEDRQRDRNSTDEVYDQFAKLCDEAGPTTCKLAGHPGQTTAQRVDQLLEKLRNGTIPAPHANPPGELDYGDALYSFGALKDPNSWPDWAEKLNAAADGDGSALETDGRLSRTPNAFAEATKSSAISCLDGPAGLPVSAWPTFLPELVQHSRWRGAISAWWLWAPCAANWPAQGNDRYAGPWNAKTDVPVLLINARYDPNTGYQGAVNVSKQLSNAVLLTLDGYGHVTSHDPSACIEKARVAYIVDLVVPPAGTVCAADHRPFGLS